MSKQIIIAEQHRIAAVFSEDQIQELVVATGNHQVSDIYLGVVENVLPGIDAAFVNIGDAERNGFIHVSDLGPLRLKKSSGSITELLAPQQKVLVQVMKEPTGTKGPRLTGNITLPGRYLVLMPYGRGVNLSRRIRSETERNRLKALAILIKPSGMGLLVRTEAEGMAEDAILEDLESLQKQWENVQQEGSSTRPPALLNRDNDFIQRVLRDMYSGDVNRIVVDSHSGIKRVKQHLMNWSAGKAPQGVLIDHHRERIPILEYFRVNAAIREALRPRVDLPSGGYVVIQPTEALTVIDVNSGSFTRSATSRETVLWTNCEAATEIARQLRLRNIAGVIIVDFIDMDSRRDQLQVLEHFNKVLKADKARPQIAQLSELGLVELTRKRQGQNIYELFGRPCQTCNGLGHLVHLPGESEVEPTESMTTGERVVLTPRSGLSVSSLPEITERLLPEKTIVLDAPQPREEPETVELDSSSNLQDLELINHPSYQDISTAGNARRRRRRRIGELDSLVRDSEPSRNHLRLAPTSGYNENRPELQLSEGLPTRSTLAERSRTVKSETLKPPTEQPEVISVEMTSDEQQMYAMMGISPLLLSHQTLKNTRNVIVTVRLPGEEPPSPKDLLEESEEEPIEVPSPEPFFESTVSMDSFSIEPPEEIAVEEFSPSPSLAVAEDLEDSLDLEDDSDSSSRRRRRRRSSAVPD
ncbi:Rne/Rng family ribonuclease [Limnoraphis robusta]|uniref:Rne/Rng family ribonuclease n=1 Tax=Limnoraphis robusta TaxID=1118279 RepID=UPI002B215C61|nr:Rne/Rng family ribonuclease [Limnoraphis robusta]MEA5496073.1 Rne/Rng family ribonuclease [Limnoraphis robusta BA-68 BA1]